MLKFLGLLAVALATVSADRSDGRTAEGSVSMYNRNASHAVLWAGGTFDWPTATIEHMYKCAGHCINKNVIATRAVIYKDEAIVALTRYRPGVPVTLAKVCLKSPCGAPVLLCPYPCWALQEEGVCSALQNVVDIFLDAQNILWVLDTGIVNTLEKAVYKCPPKVMAINVKTGKVVKTVDLSRLTSKASRLQYVVADYSTDGRVFIYVTDAAYGGIIVYDVTSGRGYRMVLPNEATIGCTVRDVLYPMLLHRADGSTCLVFSYQSGTQLFSIKTESLQYGSAGARIHNLGRKPKKMVFLGTDNGSAIFFRFFGHPDIYRWDANTCFSQENFRKVYQGSECLLATHVMPDYKRGRMRVLQSNFPDFIQGTVGCGTNHALSILEGGHNTW